jgi:hypothetical protein
MPAVEERLLTKCPRRRIASSNSKKEGKRMSVMYSLAVCKAQAGLCGHEKVMLSVAAFLVAGVGAYLFLS